MLLHRLEVLTLLPNPSFLWGRQRSCYKCSSQGLKRSALSACVKCEAAVKQEFLGLEEEVLTLRGRGVADILKHPESQWPGAVHWVGRQPPVLGLVCCLTAHRCVVFKNFISNTEANHGKAERLPLAPLPHTTGINVLLFFFSPPNSCSFPL